jgi:hypothetical protein
MLPRAIIKGRSARPVRVSLACLPTPPRSGARTALCVGSKGTAHLNNNTDVVYKSACLRYLALSGQHDLRARGHRRARIAGARAVQRALELTTRADRVRSRPGAARVCQIHTRVICTRPFVRAEELLCAYLRPPARCLGRRGLTTRSWSAAHTQSTSEASNKLTYAHSKAARGR